MSKKCECGTLFRGILSTLKTNMVSIFGFDNFFYLFRSGLITTKVYVDCETNPVPQLTVIAADNGFPPLSSTATVLVTIQDVNDNEAIFDQSFYNVSIAENVALGRCILKVSVKSIA